MTYTEDYIKATLQRIREHSRNGKDNPDLNIMCCNCLRYGNGCNGTTCQDYTGCIYKLRG